MSKYLKSLLVAILVSFGATVYAQCIPMNAPGPPRIWDGQRGCYVPQGTPPLQQGQVFQQVSGQRFVTYPQGYQQNMQAVPVAAAFANGFNRCETIGALAGAALVSRNSNRWQNILLGGIAGGIAGDMICYNGNQQVLARQAPEQVVQQQPQQVQQRHNPCAHEPGTKEGVLNLSGHPKHGQTVCAHPGDPNISRWL